MYVYPYCTVIKRPRKGAFNISKSSMRRRAGTPASMSNTPS